MGGTLVADDNAAAFCGFAFSFALHQHVHAAVQPGDLRGLLRNDLRQFFDGAGQMGELFFDLLHGGLLIL